MSDTYGGGNPPGPERPRDPGSQRAQKPDPGTRREPQAWDPYGPRDPYGRPANPYGRPDYQPPPRPEPPAPASHVPEHHAAGADERNRPAAVTIGAAWRWAWRAFGADWGVWVLMSLLVGLGQVSVVLVFNPAVAEGLRNASDPAAIEAAQAASRTLAARSVAAAGTAVGFLLQSLLYAGALAATRTGRVTFRGFFALRNVGGVLGYAVLTGALGFVGTTVPVVGLLVQVVCTLLLLPVPFLLVRGIGLGRALTNGVGLVLSHLGTTLAVSGIFAGLVVASVATCGTGLVVVVPAMLLAGAYLVQRWTGETVRGDPHLPPDAR